MKVLARYFVTTGDYSPEEKSDLKKKVNVLGGVLVESSCFPPNLTCCVLCKKIFRTEKYLGACAAGMWVLLSTFVHDSYRLRTWQDEERYEITIDTSKHIVINNDDMELADIPKKWRLHRQTNGDRGPFNGWVVTLLLRDRRKSEVYSRLLQLGGAAVVSRDVVFHNNFTDRTRPLTHVFFEGRGQLADKVFTKLIAFGVMCCDCKYISEFLISAEKAMKYVVIKSPSIDGPLELNSQSLDDQNTDCITVVMPNVDEKLKELNEAESRLQSNKVVVKHCSVHLTRLSVADLCRVQSNHHQTWTNGSCQFSLSPLRNDRDASNKSPSSEKARVIVKRLADNESSISEKLHRKKRKFRGLPIILEDEKIGSSLLTVDATLNCDTCSQRKKRQRQAASNTSHVSFVDVNNCELTMTPTATCLLECEKSQSSDGSLHSAKKMRISFSDLPEVTRFEECAVKSLCTTDAPDDQPGDVLLGSNLPSSAVHQSTATSIENVKKYSSARRNIFHTSNRSHILKTAPQSDNCVLPDLNSDENDVISSAIDPSIVGLSNYSFNSASLYTDCFDKVDGLPDEKLKDSDPLTVSPTTPVLEPVDCCSTVVFNLVDRPDLNVMPSLSLCLLDTPSDCWEDVLQSSSTSSGVCTPMQSVEEIQSSENTVVPDTVPSDDVAAVRSDSVAALTAPLSVAEITKEQNDTKELKDGQDERLCRRIVKTSSCNAPISPQLLNVEREISYQYSESGHHLKNAVHSSPLLPLSDDILSMMQYKSTEHLHVVQLLSSCVSADRYPSVEALRVVIAYLSKVKNQSEMRIAQHASDVLQRVLNLFSRNPASLSIMRNLFVKSLTPAKSSTSHGGAPLWDLLMGVFNDILNAQTKTGDNYSQEASMLFLRYCYRGLEIDFKTMVYSDRGKNQDRHLLAEWLWADYFSSTVNRQVSQLFKVLVRALGVDGHRFQTELIEVAQNLIGMAAECCHKDAIGTKSMLNDVLLAVSQPDTSIYSFCSALACQIGGSNALTVAQIERAVSTCTVDWLAFGVCRLLLNWQMMPSQNGLSGGNDENISLKSIVATYLNITEHGFAQLSLKKSTSTIESRVPSTLKSPVSFNSPVSSKLKSLVSNDLLPGRPCRRNVNKKNGKGETALHIACKKNEVATVKTLLSSADININCRDHAGWTPLHEACNRGHIAVVKELLAYRSQRTITFYFSPGKTVSNKSVDLSAASYSGITPLHDAVVNNHVEVAKLLIAHGGRRLLAIENADGKTPNDLASDEMRAALIDVKESSEIQSGLIANVKLELSEDGLNGESMSLMYCEDSIYRYLVLLFEIIKRYLSLKPKGVEQSLSGSADLDDFISLASDVQRLRSTLQHFQSGCLPETQRACLDKLECLSDYA